MPQRHPRGAAKEPQWGLILLPPLVFDNECDCCTWTRRLGFARHSRSGFARAPRLDLALVFSCAS
jgi:hypothetical protein